MIQQAGTEVLALPRTQPLRPWKGHIGGTGQGPGWTTQRGVDRPAGAVGDPTSRDVLPTRARTARTPGSAYRNIAQSLRSVTTAVRIRRCSGCGAPPPGGTDAR